MVDDMNKCADNWDCDCCKNELSLDKLCCKKAKIHKLCSEDISSNTICAHKVIAKEMSTDKICANEMQLNGVFCAQELSSPKLCVAQAVAQKLDANESCMTSLNAMNICAQNATISNLGVTSLVANDLCIPGTLRAANFAGGSKYRATVNYAVNTTYTLGSLFNFNNVVDDPNGNITSSPTTYTAPITGYYTFSFKVNSTNLTPSNGAILGSPIANPEVYVNGILVRELFSPFLTFLNEQKLILSSLITLNAGDQVTMKYKVLAFDATSGLIEIPGTVDIVGSGIEDGNSFFKITIINANTNSVVCQPVINCIPCTPMQCVPRTPSSTPCETCIPCRPCQPV